MVAAVRSGRNRRGDDLVLDEACAAEQRAFAVEHAEAQDAREQPVVLDVADDQGQAEIGEMAADVGGGNASAGGRQAIQEHRRIELDEGKAHLLEPCKVHVEIAKL